MPKLKYVSALIVYLSLVCITQAQDQYKPWALKIGINAVDYYPVGEPTPQGPYFDEFFNATDHWNIFPLTTKISLSRYWKKRISFETSFSFNQIKKFGSVYDPAAGNEVSNNVDDLAYYGFDGSINYSFNDGGEKEFEPYIGIGGGYTWLNSIGSGTLNGSLGIRYWLSDKVGLELQTTYKHVFEEYGVKHFQHALSLAYKFGGEKDSDRDGIADINDLCPNEPGSILLNGCPDTDEDGVADINDDCPKIAGLEILNGCPDKDNDGVVDKKDYCPDTPGLKSLGGCPDADNDGVVDKQDKCPSQAGPKANYGCPWSDRDGDGILDKDDKCPDVFGIAEKNGCSDLSNRDKELLVVYGQTILFHPGKSEIKKESFPVLEDVLAIIKNASRSRFTINGHTDSVGPDINNLKLSEDRALRVKNYLISNGIDPARLESKGYGETRPIADNYTARGRQQNRRVDIKLIQE